ncbi:hypothetical protein [Pseudomonas sp. RGM2987]
MTAAQKLVGLLLLVLALMAVAAGVAWQVHEWRMGKQLGSAGRPASG